MKTKKFDSSNYAYNTQSEIGIYLIHGFSCTTYEFLTLTQYLCKKNYHIIVINLPGHGTNIEDCNRV